MRDGYYLYRVEFVYRQKNYYCEFESTTKITPETDKLVAFDIASDAIKARLSTIENKVNGIHPHSIVLYGEFGNLTIKD